MKKLLSLFCAIAFLSGCSSLGFDGGTLHFDLWGRTRKYVRDNGEEIESDSILQFSRHPVTKVREASLWEEGTGWVPVDPDTLELIGGDAG